jgi:release factor glutamine methyltransferase
MPSITVKDALDEGKQLLAAANIETPSLDAELLLACTLHTDRSHIVLYPNNILDEGHYAEYKESVARRAAGECVAYITGHKEFRYLDLYVSKDVLVPRPATEALVEAALEIIDRRQKETLSVLDLCCGSGAIALSILHERPHIAVYASDISEKALDMAKQNYSFPTLHPPLFIQSDLFKNIHKKFDIIVSNPPYIPSAQIKLLAPEVRGEPLLALDGGEDGLELIRKIIIEAREHISWNGSILLEAAPDQMEEIAQLMEDAGYDEITIQKDLAGDDRIIVGYKEA